MQHMLSSNIAPIFCLLIFTLSLNIQSQCFAEVFKSVPTGCSFSDKQMVCDYTAWEPPISDKDLSKSYSNLLHSLIVGNVDGAIPTQAFNGLDGPKVVQEETFIEFDCSSQDIHLGVNTFTSNLDWVESLYINLCYIQSGLPSDVFEHLTALTKLEIAGGGIPGSVHTDSLSGLDSLTTLTINADFPDNMLDSGFLSGVPNVEILNFKSSGLANVSDDAFSGLYKITSLDMSSNVLTTLPDGLLNTMIVLETLDLSANSLTSIPQGLFKYLVSLTSLDISENTITSLPTGVFDSLVSLQKLDLTGNLLQTLPSGIFDSVVALEEIDLPQNSLEYLPGGLFNSLVNLNMLDLTDNALTTLPENLFNPLISVTSVSLTGNQWECSCDLFWLSVWSLYSGVQHAIVCSSPDAYNGMVLDRVLLSLNCTSPNTVTYTSGTDATGTTQTTAPASDTATESSSSNSSTLTLWEILTIALSGAAICCRP